MKINEILLKAWDDFDAFLAKHPKDGFIYSYAYSIRNLYEGFQENPTNVSELFAVPKKIYRLIVRIFIQKPILSKINKNVLLEVNCIQDRYVADKLGITLVRLEHVKGQFNIKKAIYIYQWLVVALALFCDRRLNKLIIWRCLPALLNGIYLYHTIDLKGIELIITQRDRYPDELAILKRANELGIKTIKYDYFPITNKIGQNTIYCQNYFYSNNIAKEIISSFKQNSSVRFIEGGFPFWDSYASRQYLPVEKPKIVSYFTQHGYKIGAYGDKPQEYYIDEILSVMPEGYQLLIKLHPLDDYNTFSKYEANNVKVIKHGDMDNLKIYLSSSFVFSICSTTTFEAKHACPNSFFINYEPDKLLCDFSYAGVIDYIDVILNKDDLKNVLNGKIAPKDQAVFIKYFNPNYPNTTQKLRELIPII